MKNSEKSTDLKKAEKEMKKFTKDLKAENKKFFNKLKKGIK